MLAFTFFFSATVERIALTSRVPAILIEAQ